MIAAKYVPLVGKQIFRRRTRSLLTIGGVGIAMFLFIAVESLQNGVRQATEESANDTNLVVYREDRFCPFTSQLPGYYLQQIESVPGVRSVMPMKIVVNNCRASLDVVTFRGVPVDRFSEDSGHPFEFIEGAWDKWKKRSDAAILGETLARRRGLRLGDQFDTAGVTAYVAGIIRSDELQDRNVAYVHLDFLQQSTDQNLGIVTQFNVKVDDSEKITSIAEAIDRLFSSAEHPTSTRSEKAFVAHVASDVIDLVRFTRILGWGCLAGMLALVGNAIVLAVQDRVKEHAVLQTLGYKRTLIARLIITEGTVLGIISGILGSVTALLVLHVSRLTLSVDGLSIPIDADWRLFILGLIISATLGALAGLVPAWQASVRPIAGCFRAI